MSQYDVSFKNEPLHVADVIFATIVGRPQPDVVNIAGVTAAGAKPFQVKLVRIDDAKVEAQFTLSIPGQYLMRVAAQDVPFTVLPRVTVGAGAELTIVGGGVAMFLGGLILWTIKRRTTKR